ncbi:MAG: hypothetical protein KAQ64_02775 [Candidatus Pacebacteria bacterium]|nr:hypothetical protein [Candidatus Paceibacterota bacterium]
MNTKKIAVMASFITALAYADFVSAANWTPLVRIPGLPATGHVDLSMYLVGLYNFLLSIVGIVAVMMLIIGGMRYITAAGNAAAISDAKDIVSNAIIGLLLALLSWVFIATINPDVLYIKQPGSGFNTTDVHGSCHKSFDPIAGTCICIDGVPAVNVALGYPPYPDPMACNDDCYDLDHCILPDPHPCIAPGSPNDFTDLTFLKESTYNKRCKCIDSSGPDDYVEPDWAAIDAMPGTQTCNDVCSDPALAVDVKYHGISFDITIGETLIVNEDSVSVTDQALHSGNDIYFDLTNVKDCKNDLVGRAVLFENGQIDPGIALWFAIDRCCEKATACGGWASLCSAGNIALGISDFCNNVTLVENPLFKENPDKVYYIRKYSYAAPGPYTIWVGITSDGLAGCREDQFLLDIEILP